MIAKVRRGAGPDAGVLIAASMWRLIRRGASVGTGARRTESPPRRTVFRPCGNADIVANSEGGDIPLRNRWFDLGLGAAAIAASLTAAPAAAASLYSVPKYAAFLVNSDTGEILYARQADAPRYPASITKVMTLYMAFEQLKAGALRESDLITVSRFAAGQHPSKLGLKPGSTISVARRWESSPPGRKRYRGRARRAYRRQRGGVRGADDRDGAPNRHDPDEFRQRHRPAGSRDT